MSRHVALLRGINVGGKNPIRMPALKVFFEAEALAVAPVNPEVDRVAAGPGVLYYARLVRLASRSRMSRIVSLPVYARMTIRNWSTTTRLLALLEG